MRKGKIALTGAILFGISGGVLEYFLYMKPKYERYRKFYAEVDPYKMLKDICSHDKIYLVSCPQKIAERYREKGLDVPSDVKDSIAALKATH